jgi:transposase InsO family protein
MPWKETSAMEQREAFIKEMLRKKKPFKHLCQEYGISEKTGYKWKKRFEEEGKHGLIEQSKAPEHSPNSLPEDMVIGILKLKLAHPFWGGKKILAIYAKAHVDAPSLSSVNRILSKSGMVKKRRVRKALTESSRLRQRIQPEAPNDVWAIDFKGWWKSDGEVCEPLTVRDLHTRMILEIRLMRSKTSEAVRAVLTELFKKYGLPKAIRSDNGPPFASPNGLLNLTNLSAWWITLGIIPDRTEKGKPGQNGSLERMHADIAREIEGKIGGGIAQNQAALDLWREEYNTVRPNEAIGMLTPADLYEPSDRKYQGDFDEIEYPAGFLTRKVFHSGEILIFGTRVSIGFSLRGLQVGLRPSDGSYDVFLADFLLGSIDIDSCCFTPLDTLC